MSMNKKAITAILLAAVISGCSCQKKNTSGNSTSQAPVSILPKDTTWQLDNTRSDEFVSLDVNKWSHDPLWYTVTEDLAFNPANTEVDSGVAKLIVKKEPYNGLQYTAGCMKSKFEIGGDTYTEIRAKMVNSPANICAAIWLGDKPVDANNPNIEIDIQETKEPINAPHRVNSSLLTWPKPGTSNTVPGSKLFYISKGLDLDFHLYGLERRNGKLSFYLDGINYWVWDASATPEFVTELRPLILSLEGHAGTPVDDYLPASCQIDWVRVYNVK